MIKIKRFLGPTMAAIAISIGMAGVSGCQTDAQTGALLGSMIGAAAGAGLDHNNRGRGALIGAGAAGLGGYVVGNERDKAKARKTSEY